MLTVSINKVYLLHDKFIPYPPVFSIESTPFTAITSAKETLTGGKWRLNLAGIH